jgi:hypothetical protein
VKFNAIIAAALRTDSNTHSHYPGSNLWSKAASQSSRRDMFCPGEMFVEAATGMPLDETGAVYKDARVRKR